MHTITVSDKDSLYGYMYINKEIKCLSVSARHTIRPPTFCSLFGIFSNIATSIEISVESEACLRNYTFHVPSQRAEEVIENVMRQFDEVLYFDMPSLESAEIK